MKHRLCLVASVTMFATPIIQLIHAQDAPPVDAAGILKSLKTIQKQQAADSKAGKLNLAQQFIAASRDSGATLAMYEDAIRATKFAGESRESTQFQEWKRGEANRMRSKAFRDGLSLHLWYLGLTMERSAGVEVKDLLADLISYTQQVMLLEDPPDVSATRPGGKKPGESGAEADEWLKQPLSSSIFVKWQLLSDYVSAIDGWELVLGNIDGIYSKTILPEFRKTKNPQATQYWDMRIARESSEAAQSGKNFDMDKFNQITMPDLLWSRARELLALDQKNRAILDMVKNIKSYPTHPNVSQWIEQVEQILEPPAAPDASAQTSSAGQSIPAASAVPATPPTAGIPIVPTPQEPIFHPPSPMGNPTPTQ